MSEIRNRSSNGAKLEVKGPNSPAETQQRSYVVMYIIIAAISALAFYFFRFPIDEKAGDDFTLTDSQLVAYTGADPNKPIYVALNGTIFDVSESPNFYGPGGHYHHFAGRDATRAWVTTCFSPKEQLTWDMKGVEKMFLPKWMDEEVENVAAGKMTDGEDMPEALREQAIKALNKVGKVSAKEKAKRREEDQKEVESGIDGAIKHWMEFFRANPKYKEVGRVVGRKPLPEDRPDIGLCEEALKKRPSKVGRFGKAMEAAMGMGGNKGVQMPNFGKPKTS